MISIYRRFWRGTAAIFEQECLSGKVSNPHTWINNHAVFLTLLAYCALPFYLIFSYGIVAAYAVADTMDRGFKTYWQTRRGVLQASPAAAHTKALSRAHGRLPNKVFAAAPVPKIKHFDPVTATVADSLMWHGAASLALPYVVINR